MSAASFNERTQAAFDAVSARLPADGVPLAQRRSALARLADLGLPHLRDDAWRYSDLRPLQEASVGPASNEAPGEKALALGAPLAEAIRLVFVDGRLDTTASSPTGATALRPLEGVDEPGARTAETRFALLNDVFALDAARYRVTGDCRLELLFIRSAGAVSSYPRVQLELAPGARLLLVERHLGGSGAAALSSAVAEVTLGRDAACQWYRVQDLAPTATHLEALRSRLAAGATLDLVLLQLGGASVRTSIDCELAGHGAEARLHVASVADERRTQDNAIHVRHLAPQTRSRQELRAIATGRASIALQSLVGVGKGAEGADSQQSLKGLIGGDGAQINLRPQLEIDVDSVRASHGATTGAIDEGMLFYLLSRGVDRETARQLLEWAFVETVISRVALPALRREFEERTVAHLGNVAALEVLA